MVAFVALHEHVVQLGAVSKPRLANSISFGWRIGLAGILIRCRSQTRVFIIVRSRQSTNRDHELSGPALEFLVGKRCVSRRLGRRQRRIFRRWTWLDQPSDRNPGN